MSSFDQRSTAEDVTAGLNLAGRLMLVTGATSGLGLETLRVLAARGADVIATGRTRESAAAACEAAGAARAVPLALDLARWETVVAAATAVVNMKRPLDVLICNAGVMHPPALVRAHGLEQQFVVNYLGHYVLTRRLLPTLEQAREGRVVMVASALMTEAPAGGIAFDNLDGSRGYDARAMYGQSKLATALFAVELARRTAGTRVTANALHPGVANTNLDRSRPMWRRAAVRIRSWNQAWVKPVEAAAATQVYLATAATVAGVTGHYFEDCNPVDAPSPHLADRDLASRLWERSEVLTRDYLV